MKLEINLNGPEGNAYWLLGFSKKLCKQLGKNHALIQEEMMSGDYENLVDVFDREFGQYVDLVRE